MGLVLGSGASPNFGDFVAVSDVVVGSNLAAHRTAIVASSVGSLAGGGRARAWSCCYICKIEIDFCCSVGIVIGYEAS